MLSLDIPFDLSDLDVVDTFDNVAGKILHSLQTLDGHSQQQSYGAGRTAQKPDMSYRASQSNMAHPLAAHNATSHQLAILVDGRFTRADAFVFGVVGIYIFNWAKNALAKEPVALRLLGSIIDCLGLCYLAITPLHNIGRIGNRQSNGVKVSDTCPSVIAAH